MHRICRIYPVLKKAKDGFEEKEASCCLRPNVQLPLFNLMLYMQLHNRCVFVKPFSLSHNYMLDRMEEKFPPHLCQFVIYLWSCGSEAALLLVHTQQSVV